MTQIKALPLTAAGFAAFGQVFEAAGGAASANQGRAERFDMPLELASADDRASRLCTAIYRIRNSALPFAVSMVERHPLSPQLFYPNSGDRFLVCACPAVDGGEPDLTALRAFIGRRAQGFVWRAGTWHSPLAALGADGDFLMQMWQCDGPLDCEERALVTPISVADCGNRERKPFDSGDLGLRSRQYAEIDRRWTDAGGREPVASVASK